MVVGKKIGIKMLLRNKKQYVIPFFLLKRVRWSAGGGGCTSSGGREDPETNPFFFRSKARRGGGRGERGKTPFLPVPSICSEGKKGKKFFSFSSP